MKNFLKPVLLALLLAFPLNASAEPTASISASNMLMEETGIGYLLTLRGPVELRHDGNTLTADSAVVTLGNDLGSLDEAIESVVLEGNVQFTGADGVTGTAGCVEYLPVPGTLSLTNGPRLAKGTMSVSAGLITYNISIQKIDLAGGVALREVSIQVTSDSGSYNLGDKSGVISGNAEIRFNPENPIKLGEESISEIVMKSDSLEFSVADFSAHTSQNSPASVVAGKFSLNADSVSMESESQVLKKIEAEGNVRLEGPDRHITAHIVTFNVTDQTISASGDADSPLTFSIFGQEGRADSIEVNLSDEWSIRLVGGSIGGTLDDSVLEGVS